MKITLTNGYPYPYKIPTTMQYSSKTYVLEGIKCFDFTNDFVIEVYAAYAPEYAVLFDPVNTEKNVFIIPTTDKEGFSIPAIIVGDMAYYGFYIKEEQYVSPEY
jgi:hypothetical protein